MISEVLLYLLMIPCMLTRVSSKEVKWKVRDTSPKLGQDLTLFCKVDNCTVHDTKRWYGGPGVKPLMSDSGISTDKTKYNTSIEKNGFILTILNLTVKDLNVSYECSCGFDLDKHILYIEDVYRVDNLNKSTNDTNDVETIDAGMIIGYIAIPVILLIIVIVIKRHWLWRKLNEKIYGPRRRNSDISNLEPPIFPPVHESTDASSLPSISDPVDFNQTESSDKDNSQIETLPLLPITHVDSDLRQSADLDDNLHGSQLLQNPQESINRVTESFTEEIESWEKDTFFETSAVATILEEVRNKSFVVVTGPSGIGKSTIVELVALHLQKTNNYHILTIMCPKDILMYLDPKIKQIYIIDDICGKYSVDQSMINLWERVERQILKYRKDNKEFRVLGTCRLEISVSSPFRTLRKIYGITECNLLLEKFVYSNEEKLNIAACHIDKETIKQLDDNLLNTYHMFPLLCKMYAASKSNPGVRFFQYPIKAIKKQLGKMNEQNECCFIGLALIVIYNNKLCKHLLQNGDDKKFKVVFKCVFKELELRNKPLKHSVLSSLQAQEGIYAKELESTITVIHDQIFDIFAFYFGKRIPRSILAHGSGTFIAERLLFESVERDCNDLKIVLPSELEHSYFNRMVEEIENNRFYNVFENVQVRNELYQGKFISFLSKNQSIIQKLLYNKWPLYLSAINGCKLLVQFILDKQRTSGICNKLDNDGNHKDMLMDKPESDMYDCSYDSASNSVSKSKSERDLVRLLNFYNMDEDERTTEEDAYQIQLENSPMVAACKHGCIDIVECLVKYGYNIDHSDTNLPTPLFSACKYGNKDVVDFLLKRNCMVDAVDVNGLTALHAACKNGNIDIVNSLLKCNNSSMNICNIDGYTPLYVACMNGHTDVVQILVDNKCNLYDGHTIYEACFNGHKDIVEILIKHKVDINLHGGVLCNTPICYACSNGQTDIVKLLLDNKCDVLDNNGFSYALQFACEGGSVDIVDLLLRNNCNINQCEPETNRSPLIVARDWNKEAVVKLLLSYEACDVNIIDHI